MKKGQIYEGLVERVDFPNKGVVNTEEGPVIVKNCLPGQKVRVVINKKRNGKAEGRLLEVLETAPSEIDSPCSLFGVCGGCTYISLPYEQQLEIKAAQVKKLLDQVLLGTQGDYEYEGILGSPVCYEYRNKMEFSFGDAYKGGPLALGMHKRGSFYDIVTCDCCKIVDEDYRKIVASTLEFFAERGIGFHHKMEHTGYLRHLLVRKAVKTGEILIALVTASPEEGFDEKTVLKEYTEMLCQLSYKGTVAGILHIVNDTAADVVQSDRTDILYGQDYFYEELLGLKFRISTFSFFQTNSRGAEVLYSKVREYIRSVLCKDGKNMGLVYDLYSGTGTIAQLMAPVSRKVIGVEIVEEAVEAAGKNAALNGLDNCEFIAGDVLKVLDDLTEKPDLIILDPPRDGIHPKALPKIIAYGVDYIVYVSCKPTSLVRDLEVFEASGYRVVKACAVDQFPQTANVETVVLLALK